RDSRMLPSAPRVDAAISTQSRPWAAPIIATQHFPLAAFGERSRYALHIRDAHRRAQTCPSFRYARLSQSSANLTGYSGCRYGPKAFWRLEIRSAGSISSNRAISLFASPSRPASAQLAAAIRSAAWLSGRSRSAIFAHLIAVLLGLRA